MRRYDQDMQSWEGTWAYHQISTGKALKVLLEERCTPEFLDRYAPAFLAKDSTLHSAYVEIKFIVSKGDRRRYYYLRDLGGRSPRWQLTYSQDGMWRSTEIPDATLQVTLEQHFQKRNAHTF